jgi:hypothetical protein
MLAFSRGMGSQATAPCIYRVDGRLSSDDGGDGSVGLRELTGLAKRMAQQVGEDGDGNNEEELRCQALRLLTLAAPDGKDQQQIASLRLGKDLFVNVLWQVASTMSPRRQWRYLRHIDAAATSISQGHPPQQDENFAADVGGRNVDVLMTHDWPARMLPPSTDARGRQVGNEPCKDLLDRLKPTLMVCGHMPVGYRAKSGGTTLVRCLAKVPSIHSLAVFDVVEEEMLMEGGHRRRATTIHEVDPCDPLPTPHFMEEGSDVSDCDED